MDVDEGNDGNDDDDDDDRSVALNRTPHGDVAMTVHTFLTSHVTALKAPAFSRRHRADRTGHRDGNDGDYSDDDDVSWKVRRAAVAVLRSLIVTRSDLVLYYYQHVAPVLVARMREREESVRLDVLDTFVALLSRTTVGAASGAPAASVAVATSLGELVPALTASLARQLRDGSVRVRM